MQRRIGRSLWTFCASSLPHLAAPAAGWKTFRSFLALLSIPNNSPRMHVFCVDTCEARHCELRHLSLRYPDTRRRSQDAKEFEGHSIIKAENPGSTSSRSAKGPHTSQYLSKSAPKISNKRVLNNTIYQLPSIGHGSLQHGRRRSARRCSRCSCGRRERANAGPGTAIA